MDLMIIYEKTLMGWIMFLLILSIAAYSLADEVSRDEGTSIIKTHWAYTVIVGMMLLLLCTMGVNYFGY